MLAEAAAETPLAPMLGGKVASTSPNVPLEGAAWMLAGLLSAFRYTDRIRFGIQVFMSEGWTAAEKSSGWAGECVQA